MGISGCKRRDWLRESLPAYPWVHRRKICALLFGAGVVIILIGRLAELRIPDTPFVVFGATLIVVGHLASRHFCRVCERSAD